MALSMRPRGEHRLLQAMNPTRFPSKTKPWRVQLPGGYFPDGKRKTKYFQTKEQADEYCRRLKKFGFSAVEQRPLILSVSHNKRLVTQPLFSPLDRRRLIPINEVSEVTGFRVQTLRRYALDGTIPCGKQVGPGKRWTFDRDALEQWWQDFNQ
jgi:predicted DNA-binding transcriptional regulator AlpA